MDIFVGLGGKQVSCALLVPDIENALLSCQNIVIYTQFGSNNVKFQMAGAIGLSCFPGLKFYVNAEFTLTNVSISASTMPTSVYQIPNTKISICNCGLELGFGKSGINIGAMSQINIRNLMWYGALSISYNGTIGNDAIAESMAYVIEKNGFGASPRKNEFPYNICELVCEEYCEWILKKPNILVAICELALMHYHSGDMFWHIVKEIAEEKLFFTTVAEFEEYFLERTEFLYGNMKNDFGEVKDCLDFLYPSAAPLLEEINRKLGNMIFRGYEYRDKNKLFIAKILESTLPIQVMTFWMNYFGIPIIVDKKQNIYAGDDLAIMVGPFAMYNFFMQRSGNDCGLTALCYSQKIPNFKKDICNNSPWKQSEKKQLCIFGMYWHMYSLGGKTVRRKE